MDNHGTYKEFSFKFVPRGGKMFVQVWLTDATFCTVEQGRWDEYAYKFKFPQWKDMPADLRQAIDHAYIAQFNPVKKDFRQHRPEGIK